MTEDEARRLVAVRMMSHRWYQEAGFFVDYKKVCSKQPFINVKMVEAVVDQDFYDSGDTYEQP